MEEGSKFVLSSDSKMDPGLDLETRGPNSDPNSSLLRWVALLNLLISLSLYLHLVNGDNNGLSL